jgi:ribonuclease P protein component
LNRFSYKNRIKKKKDFLTFRREGKKLVARHWIIYYRKNNLGFPRLAATVSRHYGNAVERNRFRRWLKEQFRKNKSKLAPFDVHFIAKATKIKDKEYKDALNEDFAKLLRKLSLPDL